MNSPVSPGAPPGTPQFAKQLVIIITDGKRLRERERSVLPKMISATFEKRDVIKCKLNSHLVCTILPYGRK